MHWGEVVLCPFNGLYLGFPIWPSGVYSTMYIQCVDPLHSKRCGQNLFTQLSKVKINSVHYRQLLLYTLLNKNVKNLVSIPLFSTFFIRTNQQKWTSEGWSNCEGVSFSLNVFYFLYQSDSVCLHFIKNKIRTWVNCACLFPRTPADLIYIRLPWVTYLFLRLEQKQLVRMDFSHLVHPHGTSCLLTWRMEHSLWTVSRKDSKLFFLCEVAENFRDGSAIRK